MLIKATYGAVVELLVPMEGAIGVVATVAYAHGGRRAERIVAAETRAGGRSGAHQHRRRVRRHRHQRQRKCPDVGVVGGVVARAARRQAARSQPPARPHPTVAPSFKTVGGGGYNYDHALM